MKGTQMWSMLLIYALIIGAMYFFLIRPRKKQQKKEEAMRNSVEIGDEIVTIGGIYGKVVGIKEDSFIIESANQCRIQISKMAIQTNKTVKDEK